MTNNQLIDERVTSVIERLEHYACNLKWTNVRGAQDLLTAADGLRELQERRKAAMDSEPVAEITEDLGRLFVKIHSPTILRAGDKLYRHAQPAPELDAIVERLNLSGYEYEGGEVTPQNAAAIVDTLLQQLDDAVQGRNAQPAPVVPGKWIPVSERMPDENAGRQVLACFKGGDISTLYYFEGRWDDAYGIVPIRQDVTHWMQLPAAPQEVKGE